jgi:hypothetical protein
MESKSIYCDLRRKINEIIIPSGQSGKKLRYLFSIPAQIQ